MSELIRTYTITIGKVYNGEEECTSPHVELAGKQHIAVNCIDLEGCKYQVQLGPNDTEPCLTFFVTCEDCDVCGTKVIKKCFCDSIDDCGDCEVCDSEGFCTSICTTICEDGTCIECNEETPCTCNQECQNGDCKCPAGSTLNANGCCDACTKDSDCDTCEVCIAQGGYNACVAKDCNCDKSGKCGTAGECVECTNSGHCPPNEVCDSRCECQCAPGYSRVDGVCIPHECPNGDDDCGPCEICSGEVCVPLQCPVGKVPAEIDGVCNCVQECNCAHPDCSSKFNYCGESSIPGKCACLPCEGDCDAGCEDPCICDDDLNRCKFNPCFGSCESGLDCGPTCGCDNGTCVPCDSLSCADDDCSRALGCECTAAQKCAKDGGCDDAPCSVASDCGIGCTCDEGICQSCSNYSCVTGDCSDRDGCACKAGNCEADEEDCGDTATLEKDDDSCELTATLIKDNCCQCPALTLDVLVKSVVDVSGQKRVTYTSEVRKGTYDGVSVTSNPRVDDFDNENIAENEPPISGTIKLSYVINYKTYSTVSGAFLGLSSADPVVVKKAYNPTDGIGYKDFVIDFPKIGTESTSGQVKSVISSIDVTFSLDTQMSFENECVYPSGTEIGSFSITTNDTFLGTPIGATITAPNCRKPLFKWTKFKDGSTEGDVFRKIYVDPIGVGAYVDTISGPTDAQSCYTYVFEPDCNCDDPVTKHVVFCNPSDFDKPVLTNCGKTYNFIIPATCSANSTKYYELLINGVAITVNGGKKFLLTSDVIVSGTHSEPITSIVLHMVCDTGGECDIEFTYDENNITPLPEPTCNADGTVDFTFKVLSTSILSVTFDGVLKSAAPFTFEDKQPNTTYTYVVAYSDGCVSDELETSATGCCNDPVVTCLSSGSNAGKYQVTSTSGTVTYLNPLVSPTPQPLPSSGIITPPVSGTASLLYTCGSVSKTISVLPYSEGNDCCRIIPSISHDGTSVTVAINSNSIGGPFTVVIGSESKTIAAGGSDTFTNVSTGEQSVVITSTTNSACKRIEAINVSDCDLGLELTLDSTNCRLVASTDEKTCDCPSGNVAITVSSIAAYPGNKISFGYTVTPNIDDSTGIGVLSSTVKIYENGGSNAVSTKSIPSLSPYSSSDIVNVTSSTSNTNVQYEAKIEVCESGCGSGTHALTLYLPASSPYSLLSVVYGSTTVSAASSSPGEYYAYISPSNISSTLKLIFSDGTTNFETLQSFSTALTQYSLIIPSTTYGTCSNIKFVYEVSLSDGCAYKGEISKTICIGQTYPSTTTALSKTDAEREMEFILFEDGVQIRRDFEADFEMVYTTDEVSFQPESEYSVKAICGCEEEETVSECFDTQVTLDTTVDSNCNRVFKLDLVSCYASTAGSAKLSNQTVLFTTDADGLASVTFSLSSPIESAEADITIKYGDYCETTYSIQLDQPDITVAYECTDSPNQEYTATFTAEIDGDSVPVVVTQIPSGAAYGTISTNTITGITTDAEFEVRVQVNGINGCTYKRSIQYKCDCNITQTTVTNSVSVCVANNVIQGSPTLSFTVARTDDSNKEWKAVTNTGTPITLVSDTDNDTATKNLATLTLSQFNAIAPNAGVNNVSIQFIDVDSGDVCDTKTVAITRNNLTYTATANECSGGYWSVTTSGGTVSQIVSTPSSSLSSLNSIPINITSVSFKITSGGCNPTITVSRPEGCYTCSDSNISAINSFVHTSPCSTNSTLGLVDTYVTSSDVNCPIAAVTVGGVSATFNSAFGTGRWRAVLPANSSGSKTVVVTDSCGCTKQTTVQVNQNCCAGLNASFNVSPSSIQVGQNATITVSGAAGYDITFGTAQGQGGAVNVTVTTISASQKTYTLVSNPGGATSFIVPITIGIGGTTCFSSNATINITSSSGGDPCAGVVCLDCEGCINDGGVARCVPNVADETTCTGGICCEGACVAACDDSSLPTVENCLYYSTTCISPCSAPFENIEPCMTLLPYSSWAINTYCQSEVCMAPAYDVQFELLDGNPCAIDMEDFVIERTNESYSPSYTSELNGNIITLHVAESVFCSSGEQTTGGQEQISIMYPCGSGLSLVGTVTFNSSYACGSNCTGCVV